MRAQDVLEHVQDFFGVMEELHRVCRDGAGRSSCACRSCPACTSPPNPTHRRAGTSATFDYFDPTRPLGRYAYSPARFERVSFHYGRFYPGKVGKLFKLMDRVLVPYCERNATSYEHYFAYVYPMHDVTYTLRAIKR